MSRKMARRGFLGGMLAAPWLAGAAIQAADPKKEKKDQRPVPPTMDMHIHLLGAGDGGSGCRFSKKMDRSLLHEIMTIRFHTKGKTLDESYLDHLSDHLATSGLTKGLIFAHDAVYDRYGKPDWEATPFYVPNDYMFHVVKRWPQRMTPCMSVNPQRADAIGELERCAELGAKALKIHPPIQGVDISEKKHAKFFSRCAELKLVVVVHTGQTHGIPVVDADLGVPGNLELALDQGCTMVACHCGTGWPTDHPDLLPDFLALLRRYKNLWGDTAALGTPGRVGDFSRLLADDVAHDRLLHGSDYPIPSVPATFVGKINVKEVAKLQLLGNPLEQDFALKEALGIGRPSAERAYRLIAGE
jgi:uncharacterized protein